jgi:hypothetical protein
MSPILASESFIDDNVEAGDADVKGFGEVQRSSRCDFGSG